MRYWLLIFVLLTGFQSFSQTLVVDAGGHGDFTTVQAAINSLPDSAVRTRRIFIRNGVYREQVFIEKSNIVLEGEDKRKTVLTFAMARDIWRCEHKDDWGVATLNLKGSDITLLNLSIVNSYGFDNRAVPARVSCGIDSVKVVSRQGHQMALRSFETTRLKVINCILRAFGGDTVSPWNVTAGMFYFKDCVMEGGVDFYCPRGWAYAEHCSFQADNGPACIWHDGSVDPDSKTVLRDCSFTGYDGFKLGRYHRDAQFYLIDCHFAENMADTDIYLVPTANSIRWGRRVYYSGCSKEGAPYSWYADNLGKAPGAPAAESITPDWVFRGRWKPVVRADSLPAVRMAATVFDLWKDDGDTTTVRWTYDEGVVWQGLLALWYNTGDARYFKYVQHWMDRLVNKDGSISTYALEDFNLDNLLCGRVLLRLYQVTGQEKYYTAASTLRRQLQQQPRTTEGSFWHKKKYPGQVWLDGLYMAQPFFAEWAAIAHEDSVFSDIVQQFKLIEAHARDKATGLLYHGWDESRQEKWADKGSGHSPNFWARAMGWYGMALVDVLGSLPSDHPGRRVLTEILGRYAAAIEKVQDPASGCWWDIPDKPGAPGNYLEASASSMFVYVLAKGVRLGYLPADYRLVAEHGYRGILERFVTENGSGQTVFEGTVGVSGLGGTPYRDGSYAYYTSEKVVPNDPKGIGAFLLAAGEMEMKTPVNKTVLLDYYFNNERRKDQTGASVRYHYTWEDQANSGFSIWGHLFRMNGAHTDSLAVAPSAAALKQAAVYIIVDPDDDREVPAPNYPNEHDITAIENWVRAGGVLVLMSNDSANCEVPHFNHLAERFGIHFNFNDYHKVTGSQYEMGAFVMPARDRIFKIGRAHV